MINLDWPSVLVGVLATLGIVTAWRNRPSIEPERHRRVQCSRHVPVAEPRSNVSLVHTEGGPIYRTTATFGRPYDGDRDGWR